MNKKRKRYNFMVRSYRSQRESTYFKQQATASRVWRKVNVTTIIHFFTRSGFLIGQPESLLCQKNDSNNYRGILLNVDAASWKWWLRRCPLERIAVDLNAVDDDKDEPSSLCKKTTKTALHKNWKFVQILYTSEKREPRTYANAMD